ncbi:MAG: hypothetical protein F6K31_19175 [Symploca sp. SIO2G7]|nr:hypothetical protein [Symploca sp. SIO2G7]
MNTYEQIESLANDFIKYWDACEDFSDFGLYTALGKASEKGETELAREVMKGAINYVIEELVLGNREESLGTEVLTKIKQLRGE